MDTCILDFKHTCIYNCLPRVLVREYIDDFFRQPLGYHQVV